MHIRIEMFSLLTLFFLGLSILFISSEDIQKAPSNSTTQSKSATDTLSFKEAFTHVQSISLEGTNESPLFDLTDIAVRDSLIAALDRQSATLTTFTAEGDIRYQVGGPGRGPGRFTNPYWVGFNRDDRIVVLEGSGNSRIQILSAENGESLAVLTEDIFVVPQSNGRIVQKEGRHHIVFVTAAECKRNGGARCVLQEHSLSSDEMIRRFAPQNEVAPHAVGMPWIMGRDQNGQSYVAHTSGHEIAVYDSTGTFIQRFDISDAPHFYPLDQASLPDDHRKAFKELRNKEYSQIRSISVAQGDLLVNHLHDTNQPEDPPTYITVFDSTGHIKASLRVPDTLLLRTVNENHFGCRKLRFA